MKKFSVLALSSFVVAVLLLVGCAQNLEKRTALPAYSTGIPAYHPESDGIVPLIQRPTDRRLRIEPQINQRPDAWYLPARDEEVWFISRSPAEQYADELPGSGVLTTKYGRRQKPIPLPLKHTDVKARVDGYIGTVEVTQQFQNPYDSKIEAVYIFPLPHDSAVNEFLMIIGERRIRGIIRERQEAERLYQRARREGFVASLMTQERPNVFTQSVANIEPGREIDVKINYFHILPYVDGWYEFVFPMVVGPRFNPPDATTGIGPAPRGAHGASGQQTEIEYLSPGDRSARR